VTSASGPAPASVRRPSVDALLDGLARGDRAHIGRAITLVESTVPAHRADAETLLSRLPPPHGPTLRLGITGPPGVGKSTFIDAFGLSAIAAGHKVGVLAVDPSSARTGGSILGDKTRMGRLTLEAAAFIRPSPAGTTLGGVAARTGEAMRILEAAGFDLILVETVGVGQSETAVADLTDLFVLLALPGAGDELQGMKRGIMELADLVLVTKADGDQLPLALRAQSQLATALRLLHGRAEAPPVQTVSALGGIGLEAALTAVHALASERRARGTFATRRAGQAVRWLWTLVDEAVRARVHAQPDGRIAALEAAVREGTLSAWAGARAMLSTIGLA
jgi:LAO/AO transport system kinase